MAPLKYLNLINLHPSVNKQTTSFCLLEELINQVDNFLRQKEQTKVNSAPVKQERQLPSAVGAFFMSSGAITGSISFLTKRCFLFILTCKVQRWNHTCAHKNIELHLSIKSIQNQKRKAKTEISNRKMFLTYTLFSMQHTYGQVAQQNLEGRPIQGNSYCNNVPQLGQNSISNKPPAKTPTLH